MKNILKSAILALMLVVLGSCENDIEAVATNQAGPQLLTPASGVELELLEVNQDNVATTLVWDYTNFGVNTAATYTVEIAEAGTNFQTPIPAGSTAERFISWTVKDLSELLIDNGFAPDVQSSIDVRVVAKLGTSTNALMQYSNIVTLKVTPYSPAVANNCPNQYAVGAGIPSAGWGWSSPLTMLCNDNVLVATTNLINDTFRFFTVNADWGSGRNYPWYINEGYKISSSLTNALDGDSNFRFTGTPGTYRIKIDGVNKTITVAQGETSANSYWLVGEATPGGWTWDNNSETELPLISDGIYEVPVVLKQDKAFRVFLGNNGTSDGNWDASKNYPAFENDGYTITPELVNAEDGDKNFKYIGATGLRVLKIDTIAKTITLN
jgi:starch-binding outer membrane protein SusE/F